MIMETTTISGSGMVDIYHAVLLTLEVPKKKSQSSHLQISKYVLSKLN